jgi:hypothetical protein
MSVPPRLQAGPSYSPWAMYRIGSHIEQADKPDKAHTAMPRRTWPKKMLFTGDATHAASSLQSASPTLLPSRAPPGWMQRRTHAAARSSFMGGERAADSRVKRRLPDSDHGRWAAATVHLPRAAHPEERTVEEEHSGPPWESAEHNLLLNRFPWHTSKSCFGRGCMSKVQRAPQPTNRFSSAPAVIRLILAALQPPSHRTRAFAIHLPILPTSHSAEAGRQSHRRSTTASSSSHKFSSAPLRSAAVGIPESSTAAFGLPLLTSPLPLGLTTRRVLLLPSICPGSLSTHAFRSVIASQAVRQDTECVRIARPTSLSPPRIAFEDGLAKPNPICSAWGYTTCHP